MHKHGLKRDGNNVSLTPTANVTALTAYIDSLVNADRPALDRAELADVLKRMVGFISTNADAITDQTFTKEWVVALGATSGTVNAGSYQVSIPTQLNGWQIIGYAINTIAVGASPNSLEIVAADATDAYATSVDLRTDAAFDAVVDEVLLEIPLIVATDDKITINVTDAGANDTGTTTITLLFNNGVDGSPITAWPV